MSLERGRDGRSRVLMERERQWSFFSVVVRRALGGRIEVMISFNDILISTRPPNELLSLPCYAFAACYANEFCWVEF